MKISIDTISKKITLQEPINLSKFFEIIKKLLPNDLWKEFELEPNVINNLTTPTIIIREYPVYPINPTPLQPPFQPTWYQPNQPFPWITCTTGIHTENGFASNETSYNLNAGTFNVDCQVKN